MRFILPLLVIALCASGCISTGDIDITIESPRRALAGEPIVIAHRGASDYLPEHTLEAYTLAHAMQVDAIEPDVAFTRDRVAICAHDITMERVTDVELKFPERARPDGSWYWFDFDLAEIKTLSKTSARSPLDTDDARGYTVATLAEMIELVQRLDSARWNYMVFAGAIRTRAIIVPELKKPAFYAAEDPTFDPAAALVAELATHGYTSAADPCLIQCFDLDTIEHLATLTDLPLVWLTADEPTPQQLDRAQAAAKSLGPNRSLLEHDDGTPKPLLAEAKSRRLRLFPWTFKNTYDDNGTKVVNDNSIHRFMFEHQVDGLFCDNPDLAVLIRTSEAVNRKRAAEEASPDSAGD